MRLNVRRWSEESRAGVVLSVHGLGQHGGIFGDLADDLADDDLSMIAVDLRGHGMSEKLPPWNLGSHVADLAQTVEQLGVEPAAWIAHSFGARVLLGLAVERPDLVGRAVLLEPGVQVEPRFALTRAEIDRLDWTFADSDAAFRALVRLGVPAHAHATIRRYVEEDLVRGPDNRYRFSNSPGAAVVAWSDMCAPLPRAEVPEMLVVQAADSVGLLDSPDGDWLASAAKIVEVPHGHNVLWEAPKETAAVIRSFLTPIQISSTP